MEKRRVQHPVPAFSLVEMAAVLAILALLMTAGVRLMSGTGPRARAAAADQLEGMIEQARAAAIAGRCHVVLAVAEPGDLPGDDERCRLGLFKVEAWPDSTLEAFPGILMGRWRALEGGVVPLGGEVEGLDNPMDAGELAISRMGAGQGAVKVRAIAINPRGGLRYPPGSAPVVLRLAEGRYHGGDAVPNPHADTGVISENILKIGRVIARAHRING
jgi:hypothetical protein